MALVSTGAKQMLTPNPLFRSRRLLFLGFQLLCCFKDAGLFLKFVLVF